MIIINIIIIRVIKKTLRLHIPSLISVLNVPLSVLEPEWRCRFRAADDGPPGGSELFEPFYSVMAHTFIDDANLS